MRDGASRCLDIIGQRVGQMLGERRSFELEQAIVEAFSNVRRHAYGGYSGLVRVRFRAERERYRVEIEDEGADQVSAEAAGREGTGFAVMRRWSDTMDPPVIAQAAQRSHYTTAN